MKLATLDDGTRDGRLLVVSRDGSRASAVPAIAATLQDALDAWPSTEPALRAVSEELNAGRCATAEELDATRLHSPLPRAYEWIDGSAYFCPSLSIGRDEAGNLLAEFDPEGLQALIARITP